MSLLRSSDCKGVFVTINIALLTERRCYYCLNNGAAVGSRINNLLRGLRYLNFQRVAELLDREKQEIVFGPRPRWGGPDWRHHGTSRMWVSGSRCRKALRCAPRTVCERF